MCGAAHGRFYILFCKGHASDYQVWNSTGMVSELAQDKSQLHCVYSSLKLNQTCYPSFYQSSQPNNKDHATKCLTLLLNLL